MKTQTFCFLLLVAPFSFFAQDNDKQAIIKVIEDEHRFFCERDLEKMAATFDQSENVLHTNLTDRAVKGWDELYKAYVSYFENGPAPVEPSIFYNYEIWMANDKAWAAFNKKDEGDGKPDSREMRGLVKRDGEWKIVSILYFPLEP